MVFLAKQLTVMCENTVQSLQADVIRINFIKHSNRVDVVKEMAAGVGEIKLVQISFSRMCKGGMSHVVP